MGTQCHHRALQKFLGRNSVNPSLCPCPLLGRASWNLVAEIDRATSLEGRAEGSFVALILKANRFCGLTPQLHPVATSWLAGYMSHDESRVDCQHCLLIETKKGDASCAPFYGMSAE